MPYLLLNLAASNFIKNRLALITASFPILVLDSWANMQVLFFSESSTALEIEATYGMALMYAPLWSSI